MFELATSFLITYICPPAYMFLILYAVLTDITSLRIPNWISVSLVFLFAVFAMSEGAGCGSSPNPKTAQVPANATTRARKL